MLADLKRIVTVEDQRPPAAIDGHMNMMHPLAEAFTWDLRYKLDDEPTPSHANIT